MSFQRLYAGIDLDAIGNNVAGVRERIPADTMIMAVIKADAYGHGAVPIAEYLRDRVDWFGVATVDEAVELRQNGLTKPILILGGVLPEDFADIVKYDVTSAIFDYDIALLLSKEAVRQGKTARVHIKADTGMSRIGFQVSEESADEVKRISQLPGIEINGLFSHFAKADEVDKSSAQAQIMQFEKFAAMLEKRGITVPIKHLCNSAGTMELGCYYNMVRMGIMLYGLYPSEEMDRSYRLYPAMELIAHITHVKELESGRGVSYGHTYTTKGTVKTATVPVGYADGYPRCLSNKGEVLIRGKRCPIMGRVCMDQMMVDVSEVPDAAVGDEVVLVGKSGDEYISVEDLADNAYSFNYEFVCGVGRRVPRVYKTGNCIKVKSYLR